MRRYTKPSRNPLFNTRVAVDRDKQRIPRPLPPPPRAREERLRQIGVIEESYRANLQRLRGDWQVELERLRADIEHKKKMMDLELRAKVRRWPASPGLPVVSSGLFPLPSCCCCRCRSMGSAGVGLHLFSWRQGGIGASWSCPLVT